MILQNLANKYSNELDIDKNICITALQELQKHALDKLHDKEVYQETGVAIIKVKLSGNIVPGNITNSRILSIHTTLSSLTSSLQKAVSEQIDVTPEKVKLIFSGKVLVDYMTLEAQGLKHGVQIMAVILSENHSDLQEYEKRVKMLETMKDDVKLLTRRVDNEVDPYLQITDQVGKTLVLPHKEKKALLSAMALHEKGKAALKKDEFALALIFLLEADKEFSSCNSQLLNSVDNYALLNLDIAWCYLCLKNVTQLPDAEERLKICESKFRYSYGPNLERVVALKGSSGNESALLMRLHLLQGIVLFHQNKHSEARKILEETQHELALLKVDDTSLCELVEFGFTPAEARIGLRATNGCVNSAVEYIQKRRQEREEIREKEKEKKILGLCSDGQQYVESRLVKQLEAMGFSRFMAIEALRHTNNAVNDAINLIHQQPELLQATLSGNIDSPFFKELINQVSSLGYDPQMALLALKKHNGNIEKAVEELVTNNGIINSMNSVGSKQQQTAVNQLKKKQGESSEFSDSNCNSNDIDDNATVTTDNLNFNNTNVNINDNLTQLVNAVSNFDNTLMQFANHFNGDGAIPSTSMNPQSFLKQHSKEQEAFKRFSEGINTDVDDHLDLTLEQEEQFLMQYLSLLS
ncbi:NEDD8 ultimate buster 1-like isoform X5 [Lycorma delicatula]|uniref:NEDD8 ultimate buster 1-like isoform X5 n=1 Tax=Lycorma delicatula TaxID=130591 RepID=UPI003F512D26